MLNTSIANTQAQMCRYVLKTLDSGCLATGHPPKPTTTKINVRIKQNDGMKIEKKNNKTGQKRT